MEDSAIIDLYWARSEQAIRETEKKYGKLFHHIANNVLHNSADAEECVNDTYLGAWNAIPPARPRIMSAYLGRITRNLALKRYQYIHASKRNPAVTMSFDELDECLTDGRSDSVNCTDDLLADCINRFLDSLDGDSRKIFVRRYWYFDSIKEIMRRCQMSKSKVESMLFRTRHKLRAWIEEEGL
ncbi:MAG: RNA polymerase sigma factor [Bacillota bacterium]|nr:RNA polymerase sigma factor [Bacillota bacterium]